MANSVFIDTGAFIARAIAQDQHHPAALAGWRQLGQSETPLFSSEPVLIETANFLARSQGGRFAARWLELHRASTSIRWLQPLPDDFRSAADDLSRFADQRISVTDALSFALARRFRIPAVFGFDHHFILAGFALWGCS